MLEKKCVCRDNKLPRSIHHHGLFVVLNISQMGKVTTNWLKTCFFLPEKHVFFGVELYEESRQVLQKKAGHFRGESI